jgi:hypothetical protein
VAPGEDLHNIFGGVAEKPRPDARFVVRVRERHAPIALHDVAGDSMQRRRRDWFTHLRRIAVQPVDEIAFTPSGDYPTVNC